jgi:hypothetical protein
MAWYVVELVVDKLILTELLKLILNHQESYTLENHNMVKFRALLGEASLHKMGQQQTCLN